MLVNPATFRRLRQRQHPLSLLTLGAALALAACGGGDEHWPDQLVQLAGLPAGMQVVVQGPDGKTYTLTSTSTTLTDLAPGARLTVSTQPSGLLCSVSAPPTQGGAYHIACAANGHHLGGSLTGLASGQSLVLHSNAGDLTLNADGAFTFPTLIADNGAYNVGIAQQPTGQLCSVQNATGAGMVADVDNLAVVCSAQTFKLGGTVTGLAAGQSLVLRNGEGNEVTVPTDGAFGFSNPVPYGGAWDVTVFAQPTGQTCTVANATGSGMQADVNTLAVTCSTSAFTLGGTVTGLAEGQLVTLRNGSDTLTLNGNGAFTFAGRVNYGGSYDAVVGTQPQGQYCAVKQGHGAQVQADVTTVQVDCVARREVAVSSLADDDSPGTLRQALTSPHDGDVITFANVCASPCTITLTAPLPAIANNVTIDGGGRLVIDGGNSQRAFWVKNGTVALQHLTIQNVKAKGGDSRSGGGGLGAGAAVFVGFNSAQASPVRAPGVGTDTAPRVTLTGVTISGAAAQGGSGGVGGAAAGGGMGLWTAAVNNAGANDQGIGGGPIGIGGGILVGGEGAGGGFGGGGGASNNLQAWGGGDGGFGGGGGMGDYGNQGGFGGGGAASFMAESGARGGYGGGSGVGFSGGFSDYELSGGGGAAFGPAVFVYSGSLTISGGNVSEPTSSTAVGGQGFARGGACKAPVFVYNGTFNATAFSPPTGTFSASNPAPTNARNWDGTQGSCL